MIILQSFRWINLFVATLFFKIVQSVQSAGNHLDWRKTKQNCKHRQVIDSWYDVSYPRSEDLQFEDFRSRFCQWGEIFEIKNLPFTLHTHILMQRESFNPFQTFEGHSDIWRFINPPFTVNYFLFFDFPIFESVIPALLPMFRFPNSCSSVLIQSEITVIADYPFGARNRAYSTHCVCARIKTVISSLI